jgi:hypothetical protein
MPFRDGLITKNLNKKRAFKVQVNPLTIQSWKLETQRILSAVQLIA